MIASAVMSLVGVLVVVFPNCDSTSTRLTADLNRSGIEWRGTKFWGLGSHEGTVALASGEVCVREGRVTGATFIADMTTISVTDIPEHEPIPRRRLREHLLSENFFYVDVFPTARLVIVEAILESNRLYRVRARLTIRGRTHEVAFPARLWVLGDQEVRAEARLAVDRHRWGVSYRGSTLRDDLVDDQFFLDLTVTAVPPQ